MLKILYDLCDQKKPVSIFTSSQDTGKFHFGIVLAVNNEEIAFQLISPNGEYDGIKAMNVEKIIRVETDGQYAEKMNKLCRINKCSLPNETLEEKNIIKSALFTAFKRKEILSIELNNSGYDDIVGFVQTIEKGQCEIKQVDEYGFEDGFSYVSVCDITYISFSSEEEKRIMNLWKFNNNLLS
ncbi:MAG: hypothetical protein ACI4QV_05700 [Acutalibacteraceae bacterium]